MAKMKTYAIEVEITTKVTLYVEARRPNGAVDRLMSDEGWALATAYDDRDWLRFQRGNARVVRAYEAGF